MKILFTRFPLESARGGAEIQTLSLMKGLNERGHEVRFLGSCAVLLGERGKREEESLDIGKPPVTKWASVSFAWRKKKMQERLVAALDSFGKIDAIVMLSMSEKLLLTEEAVKKGIKVFWVEHDRVGRWLTKNPWLPQLKKLSELATTICVSELSRKIYIDLGWKPEKVVAIPNGIDPERFLPSNEFARPPLPSLIPKKKSALHVGCVARLSPEKGVDVLIQAVSALPQVQLTIIGTGPDEGYLRKLADHIQQTEMQNESRIQILPQVNDLGDFYRSIDALVLPSRDNDPFGLVAAEAMSMGTQVIVTDQCGIAGYLSDGVDSLIAEAGSERALQEAITRLSDVSFRQRLSAAGKKTAEEKFSVEAMVGKYEDLLKKTT